MTSRTTFPKQYPAAVANVLNHYRQLRTFERLPPHRQTQLLAQATGKELRAARFPCPCTATQ